MKLLPALAAFAALLSGCASAAPPSARPALWKVADADTTLYLFGTIHVLPKDYHWQTPRFRAAMAEADALVLETVLDKGQAEVAALLAGMGSSPGLPPLLARVPAANRARLKALMDRSGLPPAALDRLETWAAALMLVGGTLLDLGLDAGSGVEGQVQAAFAAAKKPVSGLETPAEQLGYMDRLPEAAQRDFLLSMLEEGAETRAEFNAMIAAWARGDEAEIARTFDDEAEVSPALREALLHQRNLAWTRWIAKRMERPGTLLIAVGAGHLVGKDSVRTMLAGRGFRVSRVQ